MWWHPALPDFCEVARLAAFGEVGRLALGVSGGELLQFLHVFPNPASTLRWSLLQTLAASPYFLIRQLVTTKAQFDRVMGWWLWVGAIEASFGILCYLSYLFFRTDVGVTLFFYIGFIPGIYGSLWEPNIFGSYCTCFAVMFLFYYLAGKCKNAWYMWGFAVSTVGLLLSLARQAWVCLIFVGGGVILYSLRGTKPDWRAAFGKEAHTSNIQWKRLAFIGIGIFIALVIALAAMRGLSGRLATLSLREAADDPTVVRRAGLIALAMDDIQQHPLVGLGTSSFQLLYLGDDDSYQGVGQAWLGSFFFRVMHDTGIVGTVLLGWFIVNLGRRAWRILSEASVNQHWSWGSIGRHNCVGYCISINRCVNTGVHLGSSRASGDGRTDRRG